MNAISKVAIDGLIALIPRSKHFLAPIYEAITNSYEAIAEKTFVNEEPEITVKFFFTGLVDEIKELSKVEVIDNGTGFTDKNFNRMDTLLDRTKGFNNRGSGRIQYLHRAKEIEIISHYIDQSDELRRNFKINRQKFIYDHQIEKSTSGDKTTRLILKDFIVKSEEKTYFDNLQIDDVKRDLKRKFLLRLYLSKTNGSHSPIINIEFIKNEVLTDTATLKADDIPDPVKTGEVKIPYVKVRNHKSDEIEWDVVPGKFEILQWSHFVLPKNDADVNGVFLCSKDIQVQELQFNEIKRKEVIQGNHYITAVHGAILDNSIYVNDAVDGFKFPNQHDAETSAKTDMFFDREEEFLFFDDIKRTLYKILPSIYSEIMDLQQHKKVEIEAIAAAHGISREIALSAGINLTDNEQQMTEKMFRRQAEELSKRSLKIKKIYESLEDLNPSSDDYQTKLQSSSKKLMELIPQQNKEELSRYIIRREMVAKILRLILDTKLKVQTDISAKPKKKKDPEGLLHNLIFKRKSKDTYGLNDLWILSEEFVHFDGCSEISLNQIKDGQGNDLLHQVDDATLERLNVGKSKLTRRPDIFLFLEEGKCIIIELKHANEPLENHIGQLHKYCSIIANFSKKPINNFYCYLIGEKFDTIDVPGEYRQTVTGDWVSPELAVRMLNDDPHNPKPTYFIEIMKLSSIHIRAHLRNQSFANKLGIRIDQTE